MNKTFLEKKTFSLSLLLHQKLKTLLIVLIQIKPQEIDTIPPKLNKIAADFLTPLLTVAINKIIEQNVLPDSPKITSVIPLDNGNQIKMNFQIIDLLVF